MSPLPVGILAGARLNAPVTYQDNVLFDSPSWYFPFNDVSTPPDDEMNFATSVTTGGTLNYGAAGLGDRSTSLDFAGSARVNLGTVNPAPSAVFTVEALVKFDTLGAAMFIASRDDGGSTNRVYRLDMENVAKKFRILIFNSAAVATIATGTTTVTTGTSYHVAGTYDGTSLKLYVNGTLEATTTASITLKTVPSVNHHIGAVPSGSFSVDGKIAGVAFYTTALSAGRILAHSVASGH